MSAPKDVAGAPREQIQLRSALAIPQALPIPNQFVFVWFGRKLPAFATIAIQSALKSNPGSTATLYHESNFVPGAELLGMSASGLQFEVIAVDKLLVQAGNLAPDLNTAAFSHVYSQLKAPAARSNLVRLLALFTRGGMYLDTDTLTLRDMSPLRQHTAFCGEERVLWPVGRRKANLKAISLAEIRRLCAAIPYAYRMNRRLLPYYSLAANNAVLGAQCAHPFILELLKAVVETPERDLTRRFVLGTHLLQNTLARYQAASAEEAITVLSPDHFYPVGPMISRHYFGHYRSAQAVAEELLSPSTYIVHWYASVAQLDKRDGAFIEKNAQHEVFSYLCQPFVTERRRALEQEGLGDSASLQLGPAHGLSVPTQTPIIA